MITAEEFNALDAEAKGYVVYICGSLKDEPNVPESYEPAPEEREAYERGQQLAILAVQDCP